MAVSPRRDDRLGLRIRSRELDTIREAARVSGRYVSEIVRDAAVRRARRLIREHGGDGSRESSRG